MVGYCIFVRWDKKSLYQINKPTICGIEITMTSNNAVMLLTGEREREKKKHNTKNDLEDEANAMIVTNSNNNNNVKGRERNFTMRNLAQYFSRKK